MHAAPSIQRAKVSLLSLLVALSILSACSIQLPFVSSTTLTVGGKLDTEAQLLTKMYVLLLRHGGFSVTERARLGDNAGVFQAITKGTIDLYPEFTTTGLTQLKMTPTGNPTHDYQAVKQGYEKHYQVTWLNMSSTLNDTYGLCMSKSKAKNIEKISDLSSGLVVAGSQDGLAQLPAIASKYGINLRPEAPITEVEKTFEEASTGNAQLNVCYTTSPLIAQNNFLLLQDDKNAFPAYYPAPIVRKSVLDQNPKIATILNPLAPLLTTDVSSMLQAQVEAGFSVQDVATNWLKSKGLL